ncbi:LuxR C-terminal-related transcriptional regulator [Lentzea sp. BCCO 10_0061]|uniref:LuxR C-terminal-related transcriptional regulator n=1 Tax=Lentzea sokolovensis TaxID=3095429 RepID=A0ABU4UPG2_9PSEU|nr:LuxR C-terminal-related transcriptional regulator [Lentzea sp. BCCO 10_0061]MDX8141388.1 LuxR C-terminal-related transcriptional regulator [Lentzea sp. BCCO 10_0061]
MIRVRLPEAEPAVIAGVAGWLTSHPDITVAADFGDCPADVYVAVAGFVDRPFLDRLGETARRIGAVVVLALDNMADDALTVAEQTRVVSLVPRATVDRDRLVAEVVTAAQGRPSAREVLAEALAEVRATAHHRPMSVVRGRDLELLKLLACGWGTDEIAAELSLSHRTVVNRVQLVVKKCGAQNRCEAVAQAARAGLV